MQYCLTLLEGKVVLAKCNVEQPQLTPELRTEQERAQVIRSILQRRLAEAPLNAVAVKNQRYALFVMAIRLFGNWGSALAAAGLDVEAFTRRRTWTISRVIEAVRDLHSRGIPINYKSVRDHDQGLAGAAYKLIGNWSTVLSTVGYDPDRIRRSRRPWTRSEIIAIMQQRAAEGVPPIESRICPPSARFAVKRLFGSFAAALRTAGVLRRVGDTPRWSKSAVVNAIRRRHANGEPINCLGVIAGDTRLYDAARNHCGSWNAALRAAGFDPPQIRRKLPPWVPETVLAELRRRAKLNDPAPTFSHVRPTSIMRACITFFGSLEEAAAAARVDPAKIACRRGAGRRRRRYRGGVHCNA